VKLFGVTFEIVQVPLAAVFPVMPEIVTCSPLASTAVVPVVVIVIGVVLLAPVITPERFVAVGGDVISAVGLQLSVTGL
jgi:hypothetical protein